MQQENNITQALSDLINISFPGVTELTIRILPELEIHDHAHPLLLGSG
ncbi:MAG TPA: hypothetical protein VM123_10270 [archaeon]|nr:hypothetical protein [archaeon]